MERLQNVIKKSLTLVGLIIICLGSLAATANRVGQTGGRVYMVIPAGQTAGQVEVDYGIFQGRPLAFATAESDQAVIVTVNSYQEQGKLIIYAHLLEAAAQDTQVEINWRVEGRE